MHIFYSKHLVSLYEKTFMSIKSNIAGLSQIVALEWN